MRRTLALALGLFAVLASVTVVAQSNRTTPAWTPPRTADGQPDLQGTWTNATITPFERPAALGDKAYLTKAEVEALEKQAAVRRDEDGPPRAGDVGSYNQVWFDSGERVVSTRRTSLVIDPPDGRVPLRPEAEAARDYAHAHEGDSFDFMSVWDRCITRGVPGGMFPAGYNNAYEIVQAPGYVMIHYEMIHEARIIPIDGRPHLPDQVRSWNGDPRGRWDGHTLVVETTNYNAKGWIATQAAAGRVKGVPQTESLRVVERFTPIDANTIDYQVTIDDPAMYTRPWTVAIRPTASTSTRATRGTARSRTCCAARARRSDGNSAGDAGERSRDEGQDARVIVRAPSRMADQNIGSRGSGSNANRSSRSGSFTTAHSLFMCIVERSVAL